MRRFATIGTFDGVHRGHRLLLDRLLDLARERDWRPAAFIFEKHPLALIAPERMPAQLTTFADKAAMVEALGVEVIPLRFDRATRGLTSRQYMAKIADEYDVFGLLVGHDNRFGSDRSATFADYERQGRELGMEVVEAPVLEGINSSAVRSALHAGDAAGAASMLGRFYRLSGRVVHGQHLGTQLGFPTANMHTAAPALLVPAPGVYVTRVQIDGEQAPRRAVTNIGVRPSVPGADGSLSIETHIPGFEGDIYGKAILLDFIDKIRDEQRFGSLDELKSRLREDIAEALSKDL